MELAGYRAFRASLAAALLCLAVAVFCPTAAPIAGAATPGLSNEFVSVTVNSSSDAMGRFSLSTTGGDPSTSKDDGKPLIYGGSDPWTSFTTVRIDGTDYVFGGQSMRRAGKSGRYGTVVESPHSVDGGVRTVCQCGDVEVTQNLSLSTSTTTSRRDTLMISYTLRNKGVVAHAVGLRLVVDTMLGMNDGAPFRLPSGAVAKSTILSGAAIPDFWQAFDSLLSPTIRAQGTLRGDRATAPDTLILADWGTLADETWTDDILSGRSFTRKGEDEADTATALVWNPAALKPDEARTYSTFYGLGGVTVSNSGGVMLGLTSPSEFTLGKGGRGAIPVIAYVENGTQADINALSVSIRLPQDASLEPGSGDMTRNLKSLAGVSDFQCAWSVRPPPGKAGAFSYDVVVSAGGKAINKVTRTVNVRVPPSLVLSVAGDTLPGLAGVIKVTATVRNLGDQRAYDTVVSVKAPADIVPARNEVLTREVGFLEPSASVTLNWIFYSSKGGSTTVSVTAVSTTANDTAQTRVIKLD
jgi:hypothetical protein